MGVWDVPTVGLCGTKRVASEERDSAHMSGGGGGGQLTKNIKPGFSNQHLLPTRTVKQTSAGVQLTLLRDQPDIGDHLVTGIGQ